MSKPVGVLKQESKPTFKVFSGAGGAVVSTGASVAGATVASGGSSALLHDSASGITTITKTREIASISNLLPFVILYLLLELPEQSLSGLIH
jgi:hypothetical protein